MLRKLSKRQHLLHNFVVHTLNYLLFVFTKQGLNICRGLNDKNHIYTNFGNFNRCVFILEKIDEIFPRKVNFECLVFSFSFDIYIVNSSLDSMIHSYLMLNSRKVFAHNFINLKFKVGKVVL